LKLKVTISIDEFDSKKYEVRIVEPNKIGKAVITHYLNNIHNGISKYYIEDALNSLVNLFTYKQDEGNSTLASE
jgi:DNA (cytosine-5)-methyltransferase 1